MLRKMILRCLEYRIARVDRSAYVFDRFAKSRGGGGGDWCKEQILWVVFTLQSKVRQNYWGRGGLIGLEHKNVGGDGKADTWVVSILQ